MILDSDWVADQATNNDVLHDKAKIISHKSIQTSSIQGHSTVEIWIVRILSDARDLNV